MTGASPIEGTPEPSLDVVCRKAIFAGVDTGERVGCVYGVQRWCNGLAKLLIGHRT